MPSKEKLLVNDLSRRDICDKLWEIRKQKRSAIYYLFDGDEIVYVGQSIRVFTRIRDHLLSGKQFNGFAVMDTKQELLNQVEAEEIVSHNPRYNQSGILPPNSTYMTVNQISKQYRASRKRVEKVIRENNISVSIVIGGVSYYNMRQPVIRTSNKSTESQPE